MAESNRERIAYPLLNELPRPGDFRIGSKASRAAARALLEAKKSGKQNTCRTVFDCVGKQYVWGDGEPRGATCTRSLWDDGLVHEIVDLTHSDLSEKELDQLTSRVPVDGATYKLEEFRSKTAVPQPAAAL